MSKARYLHSTVKRGRVTIRSPKQHRLLHARKLPHTHVYRKGTRTIRKRWP